MEFLNEPVEVNQLPRAEELSLVPVERTYLNVLRIHWAIVTGILLIGLAALFYWVKPLQDMKWISIGIAGWLLVTLLWYLVMQKSFQYKSYAIRDKDMIYQTGWIIRHIHTCPFNRIQHITVTIGPFERRWGLATLVLYTAGSNNADMQISGLQEPVARSLKAWITKNIADEPTEL